MAVHVEKSLCSTGLWIWKFSPKWKCLVVIPTEAIASLNDLNSILQIGIETRFI